MSKRHFFFIILLSLSYNVAVAETLRPGLDWGAIGESMFYPDGSKYEFGYTYASIAPANTHFPIGFYGEWAGEWAWNWVAISGEIAFNASNKTYPVLNKEYATYDPFFYLLLGLGWNCNVFSLNFNMGLVDSYRSTRIDFLDKTIESNRVDFFLQPSLRLHIPVDKFEHFISIKIGYNICPSMHDFNGLNIGLGFGGWY